MTHNGVTYWEELGSHTEEFILRRQHQKSLILLFYSNQWISACRTAAAANCNPAVNGMLFKTKWQHPGGLYRPIFWFAAVSMTTSWNSSECRISNPPCIHNVSPCFHSTSVSPAHRRLCMVLPLTVFNGYGFRSNAYTWVRWSEKNKPFKHLV